MRNETLVREVVFGKGIARITVSYAEVVKRVDGFEGIDLGTKIIESTEVELVAPNGKVIENTTSAQVIKYADDYSTFLDLGLSVKDEMSKIGNTMTIGGDAARNVNQAIKEMKEEINAKLEMKTPEQIIVEKEEKEKVVVAKEVVEVAERNGTEKLMTSEKLSEWRKNYNEVVNEGGGGYIPDRVSKEQYESALRVLGDAQ